MVVFAIAKGYSQNYLITFAGTGASHIVDSVKVENITQCTDTSLGSGDILNITSVVGINELNNIADNTLHIFPNPMKGFSIINFNAIASGNAMIELYDVTGKRITQTQDFLPKGNQSYCLKGIGGGVYILNIKSEEYSYTSKIVSNDEATGTPEINHISAVQATEMQNNVSITGKVNSVTGSTIKMQFNMGDTLKLTGKSGNFRTVIILRPTGSQTVTFPFVNCTDADSNHYAVVQIGTQIWMEENLKTTKYRNGNPISNVTDATAWSNLSAGAYCDYNNSTNTDTINTYGRLYNWFAVNDSRNLAPAGWHIASDSEFTVLGTYLDSVAGGKVKEKCMMLWLSPNAGATNSSGFTALPGGYRNYGGVFQEIGQSGYWWSSTDYSTAFAMEWELYYNLSNTYRNYSHKLDGFSIRCIKN